MLKTQAPFPHVGSFALLVDTHQPESQQRAELVRLMRYDVPRVASERGWLAGEPTRIPSPCRNAAVSFPLRTGASGNRLVYAEDLIDGTPLTKAEERELADLQRTVARQVRPNRAKIERAESLRKRAIFSVLLAAELRKLAALDARDHASVGRPLPRDEHGEKGIAA